MVTLTLRNIPADLHAMLKESAEKSSRSLNSEILVRLEGEFAAPRIDREAHDRKMRELVAGPPRADHSNVDRYKRQGRA